MNKNRSVIISIKTATALSGYLMIASITAYASSAGSGGHASLLSQEMLFKGINFLILLYLLYRFARKPIAGILSKVAFDSKETMDSAKDRLQDADEQLEEYRKKLHNLENELEERRKSAIIAIEEEKDRIISDAETQAKKLEEQSKDRIEQDLLKAKADIREFIANESVKFAESIISNEIDDKDKKSLIDTYTNSLKETV